MKEIINFFANVMGINGGGWLNWWGGLGSSLSEFGIFVVVWKKLECHAPGCHRIGLHRTADGLYVLCRKHHPDVKNDLTLEDIHASHFAAQAKQHNASNDAQ